MTHVLNIDDAESRDIASGDCFEARIAPLADKTGGQRIGANLTTVPPGKAAFPMHHHYGNEEHFFIVSGTGTLRLGDDRHAVRPGDYVVTPPGGPELAHQLVNTGSEDLRYLSLSTKIVPEVVGYPDSGKTGVLPVPFGHGDGMFLVEDTSKNTKGYWDGEDGSEVKALTAPKS